MKYYLSSYKLGNETEKLKELIKETNEKFGYIPNALDYTGADQMDVKQHCEKDIKDLGQYGAKVEMLDLKNYFEKENELKTKLACLGGLYVSGGNTFVLRQAMRLSGLDKIIHEMSDRNDFLYIGYSAGVCVITPNLKPYAITDNAMDFPYKQIKEQVWEGLNILDFVFQPHYHSNHPESKSTDKEIQYCIDNKILFKAYKDGEVMILE
ncbi:MAG: Type 1 glutamine amidotransferase-like domain-containing protein [Patescibacteria group bacterium]